MEADTSLLLLTYTSRFYNAVRSLFVIITQVSSLQAEKKIPTFCLQTHLWDEIATLTTKTGAQSVGKAHWTKFSLCVITGVT